MSTEKEENRITGRTAGRRKSRFRRKWLKDFLRPSKRSESETDLSDQTEQKEYDFFRELKEKTKDLIYISETDADVQPFIGEITEPVGKETLLSQIGVDPDVRIEEREFEDFFGRLTTMQDWFDDEHRAVAERFIELKTLLTENLKNLKVFKVGEIEIEIYAVGLDRENRLVGVKTQAVET